MSRARTVSGSSTSRHPGEKAAPDHPASRGPRLVTIHTDGSAIGNPGPAGIGFVLQDETGAVIFEASRAIGHATNNVAEYRALIAALEEARAHGAESVAVRSDSELMVRQMTGRYRVKHPDLKPLFAQAKTLASAFAEFSITHVRREGNRGADRLAFHAAGGADDMSYPP